MTTPTIDSTATIPLGMLFIDLEPELAATRKMLERFPAEHADWKPHEKSGSLATLATHVAELPGFGAAIASRPEWVVGVDKFERVHGRTVDELLAIHEKAAEACRQALASLDAASLDHVWRMRKGDVSFLEGPRALLLRRLLFGHISHHRGQLSVYYRMLGVPVPGMYGPSADDV
jgi:uncharacterized damage-inducible protein DinB